MASTPPTIFDPTRRQAIRRRMAALQARVDAPRYLLDDMAEDVFERLAFLRHQPTRALVVGDWSGAIRSDLTQRGCNVVATDPVLADPPLVEEEPYPAAGFDLAVSIGTLDTVNDLPGALIHLRQALAPGGLLIASFPAAGSLAQLRRILLAAEPDRPAARMHPLVDVRAGAQLLQRAGFADPVADIRPLAVRYSTLRGLVGDLRAQGLSAALADRAPTLPRAAIARAEAEFAVLADADGKLAERFEILTLSGWRR